MRGVLLAVAVMAAAPFVRRFGNVESVNLTWGETRKFAEELESDEASERRIFWRVVVVAAFIAAVIAARIALI